MSPIHRGWVVCLCTALTKWKWWAQFGDWIYTLTVAQTQIRVRCSCSLLDCWEQRPGGFKLPCLVGPGQQLGSAQKGSCADTMSICKGKVLAMFSHRILLWAGGFEVPTLWCISQALRFVKNFVSLVIQRGTVWDSEEMKESWRKEMMAMCQEEKEQPELKWNTAYLC